MDLNELRKEIDRVDDELVRLFVQRMQVSAQIADYKKQHDLPIFVPSREAEKLQDVAKKAGEDMEVYTKVLYSMLFELSRGYQSKRNAHRTALFARISDAITNTPKLLRKDAFVACLNADDENTQMACQKIFGQIGAMPFKNLEGVLAAVEQGMCHYGIVPLESTKKQIYDLLMQRKLYIVRCLRLHDQAQYICISKQLEIYPGADRSSVRMALSDRPGALYKVLARLYTLGINVVGLESRPIAEKNFQGMFYFDLETSVYSDEFVQLICEMEDLCEDFAYLGSYTEVV
ncbi:MAG: chorismate mutase [Oscillospiraceae bacterium]|nr:chorismate mutase [Oscillospiraceae bacterium]